MGAKKRVGDLLAVGLLLWAIGYLSLLSGIAIKFGTLLGYIGATIVILVEVIFLYQSWFR